MKDIFQEADYKALLRGRVKALAAQGKRITLKRIAEKIPLQATYLSKTLHDEKAHLNEDHLFSVCHLLEFLPNEIDFIFLLRAHAISQDKGRREFLQKKLDQIRRSREVSAPVQEFRARQLNQEMDYLFDPLCVLVHVSLAIPGYLKNPGRLCPLLGITSQRLQRTLKKLEGLNFVELGEGQKITRVLQSRVHFGTDHPLMRLHQTLLRLFSATQVIRLPEEEKHCFMTTFSTDDETMAQIKARFRLLVKETEHLVKGSPQKRTYQMNFDLFSWF